MSFGTHGAAAIPDRLSVDYAPTGRASCKSCGAVIAQNTVRVGEKVRSPWHDGFDVKYHHVRCAARKGSCVHDFKGFQRLRWVDQMTILDRFSADASATPLSAEAKRVKRLNEMVWKVKDRLEKVPKAALKELIEENGIFVSEKATPTGSMGIHGK